MTKFALSHKEAVVLEIVRSRGRMLTRIEEAGDGDREFVQPTVPGVEPTGQREAFAIPEDNVLTCLHALEDRGLIRRTIHLHAWSATEYVCEWTLCEGEEARPPRPADLDRESLRERPPTEHLTDDLHR